MFHKERAAFHRRFCSFPQTWSGKRGGRGQDNWKTKTYMYCMFPAIIVEINLKDCQDKFPVPCIFLIMQACSAFRTGAVNSHPVLNTHLFEQTDCSKDRQFTNSS